jgi:membrane protein implicated in regulation of membrane protease activity
VVVVLVWLWGFGGGVVGVLWVVGGVGVVLVGWANETSRIARVKYRGASWDARLARPDERPLPGTTLYIEGQEGNTLVVGLAPPVG